MKSDSTFNKTAYDRAKSSNNMTHVSSAALGAVPREAVAGRGLVKKFP